MTKNPELDITFEKIIVEGKRKWLASNGKILPYVSGGAGDDGDEGEEGEGEGEKPKPKDGHTQAEVNRMIATERKAERLRFAKAQGFETVEAMETAVKAAKAKDESEKSDLKKAQDRATELEGKHTTAAQELAAERLTTRVEKALIGTGLTVKAAERIRKLVDVTDPEVDEQAITDAIASLKTDMPHIFPDQEGEEEGEEGKKVLKAKAPPSPGSKPPAPGKVKDSKAAANALFFERHPDLIKKS